uniref:glycosyltransferase family 2 protein n=1 Tax=Nocardiopsis salina TaxID=245836 RepID=UPI000366A8D2
DPGRHTPQQVRDEVAAGRADELFDPAAADPHWIERNINRSNQLRTAGRLAYKVFIGATGSVHRSLFDRAGGLDPELVLGGDTEFAFRLHQQGAVFVPDLDTSSWHLGRTQMQTRREAGSRFRSPYVSNRVPDFHLRRKRPDRLWEVPYVDVVVGVDGQTLEAVDTTASALLDGTTPDLRMWLVGPWSELGDGRRSPLDEDRLDLRLVQETFRGDPRVRFVESLPERDPRVPFRLDAPAGSHPTRTAVVDMVRVLDRRGAGLMCTPLPGATRAGGGLLRMERASSFARALHLEPDAHGTDLDRVVEKVAGTHWTPGADFVIDEEDGGEEAPATEGGSGRREKSAERKDAKRSERRELERMNAEELRRELERARNETERLEARARRAERKLRWSAPGFGRRLLGRVLR